MALAFKRMDKNHDGVVSWDEFAKVTLQCFKLDYKETPFCGKWGGLGNEKRSLGFSLPGERQTIYGYEGYL